MIATKREQGYCITMCWLRRKISFSLCMRGSRDKHLNQEEMNFTNMKLQCKKEYQLRLFYCHYARVAVIFFL